MQARELGVPPSSLPLTRSHFPGKDESGNGTWSMQYLKRRVLKPMEERGEVLKMTRGRWEKEAPGSEVASLDETTVDETQGETKADAKGKKSAKRDNEEHIWVTRDMWEERRAMGTDGRERLTEAKVAAERAEGDSELRAKYGLQSGP